MVITCCCWFVRFVAALLLAAATTAAALCVLRPAYVSCNEAGQLWPRECIACKRLVIGLTTPFGVVPPPVAPLPPATAFVPSMPFVLFGEQMVVVPEPNMAESPESSRECDTSGDLDPIDGGLKNESGNLRIRNGTCRRLCELPGSSTLSNNACKSPAELSSTRTTKSMDSLLFDGSFVSLVMLSSIVVALLLLLLFNAILNCTHRRKCTGTGEQVVEERKQQKQNYTTRTHSRSPSTGTTGTVTATTTKKRLWNAAQ